jgi:hydroxymethylpyrimidine pyrophosphatase-like HAD family hydrolase
MRYRALAFDLDGTLLNSDEHVSDRNRAALAEAKRAGLELIVASARWRALAERAAAEIETASPLVACSGAEVWDPKQAVHLLDIGLPDEFTKELFAICDANRCVATIVAGMDVFLKLDGLPDPSQVPPEMTAVTSLTESVLAPARIGLIQGTATVQLIEDELGPRWGDRVRFVESFSSRGKRILTLTATGADKGVALGVACGALGIDPAEVVAFGDAENDLEMFRIAGASVAMGQASSHVRESATFVTAPNADDGVAVAVERLLSRGDL